MKILVLTYLLTVLALLVTASQHRRRGAGSLIVQWGVQKSEELRLPAYLQASEQGRRLYRHYGFEDIDTVEYNLSEYGLEGVERMTEMLRKPSSNPEPKAASST
jgi:predicted GNAT family N-acyltransferase